MFDFIDIIKASSVIWIKRYLDTIDRNWKSMFECFCNKTNLPVFLQSNFDVSELPPNLPLYYKNSIIIWQSVSHHVTNNNLLSNCLWYNKGIKLGGKSVYSKNLMSIGMWTVADLYECDEQTVIPFSTWQKRGAVELDRLTWLGIVNAVKPFRNKFCTSCIISAGIVVNDKFISIQNVTQRDIKNSLSKKKYSKLKELDFKFKIKANSIHGNLNDEIWKRLFLSCHQVTMNNKTKELQYKILMRYVANNYLLYKMKKVNSQTCSFCMLDVETIEHLFFYCILVKNIYIQAFNEWISVTNCNVLPTPRNCILGDFGVNLFSNVTYRSLYLLTLFIKSYIMQCKYENTELSYVSFKRVLKCRVQLLQNVYNEEAFEILIQLCTGN